MTNIVLTPEELEALCKQGWEQVRATSLHNRDQLSSHNAAKEFQAKESQAKEFQAANDTFARVLEADPRKAEALHGRALCLRQLKLYSEAHRVLNRALFLYPTETKLLLELGLLRLEEEKYDQATQAFDKALENEPSNEDALAGKVKSLRLARQYEEAEKAVADALTKQPGSKIILTERARLYLDQKQYDAAVEAFFSAGDEDALAEAIYVSDQIESEQALAAVLSRQPNSLRFLKQNASLFEVNGLYDKAKLTFDRILEVEPEDQGAWEGKIRVLRFGSRFHEAEKVAAEAIRKFPGNQAILTERAELLCNQKLYDQAVEAFIAAGNEDALDSKIEWCFPDEPEPLLNAALDRLPRSVSLLKRGAWFYEENLRYTEAVAMLERVLALDLDDKEAWLGKIRTLRLNHRFADATEAVALAIQKHPDSKRVRLEQANLQYDQKQYREAIESLLAAKNESEVESKTQSLRAENKFAEADTFLEAALERLPQKATLWDEKGWLCLNQGQYDQAVAAFDRALKIDPANLHVLISKLTALRWKRDFAKAEAELEEAFAHFPRALEFHKERGYLHYDQGQYRQAVAAFSHALTIDPNDIFTLLWKIKSVREIKDPTGDNALKEVIDDALNRLPESPTLLCERARWYYDCCQFNEADQCLRKAIEYDPSNHDSYFIRAEVLRELDRSDEAARMFEELEKSNPDNLYIRSRVGWFYLQNREFDRAKEKFESVLKIDSKNVSAINGLGSFYADQEQYGQAEPHFRRALEIEPNEWACHSNLAFTLIRQAKPPRSSHLPACIQSGWLQILRPIVSPTKEPVDSYSEAEKHCRIALELYPNFSSSYASLGIIAFKRGDLFQAEELLKKSIALDPKKDRVADLAALYALVGRYKEAAELLESALPLQKTNERVRIELGNVYLQTDKIKDAVAMFRQAIAINPKSADSIRGLAIALMRTGEFTDAARTLKKAVRELDVSKRWQLHLTLCQALAELGDKSDDSEVYEEALKEARTAISLAPEEPAPYFYAGIVHHKLEDFTRALAKFRKCLEKDPNHFEAEQNARRLQTRLRRERIQTGASLYGGIALGILCLILLITLWVLYLFFNTPKNISETTIATMSPFLLALVFIGFVLPWLSRLKLPGVEAELTKPKEKVSAGPSGSVSFGSSPISAGPK